MFTFFVLILLAPLVAGDEFTPTAPGPGDVFKAGENCTISWMPSSPGGWTNVSVSLMSGSNDDMKLVTTVAHGLDGSNPSFSPFNWTCPEVEPYSAIYFYQFTNGNDTTDPTWTTRFTIASSSGASEPPEHSSQPNGDAIPWGAGSLRGDRNDTSNTMSKETSSTDQGNQSQTVASSRMDKQRKTASTDRQATPTVSLPSASTVSSPPVFLPAENAVSKAHHLNRVSLLFITFCMYILSYYCPL
ncbi:hypothetical protein K435DRAFT_959055 [Dendrothele bispora CBS 962.96]|uniref:Yeast cell wall synthesis Kre9/Knh1-like N-terminal domain-containing protein n=1 Tax=Dendrothele bispora (strain CBS 962.96) TaxID=1314807 RepID=A0A4S8MYW1_DENBC|nr:hypothetical protein K435DRAFT_959055 [Dendrothele bispora CBS 962.96]